MQTIAQSISKTHPEWSKNVAIYEANIRQHSSEGTFKEFEQHLPRLKELGFDLLWLMPIQPIGKINRKGTLGSYYSISDYKSINPEFGTIIWDILFEQFTEEAKALIAADVETIINYDPRMYVNQIGIDATDQGIRIEATVTYVPFNVVERMVFNFDKANSIVN